MRIVIDGYNLIPAIAELRRVLHQDLEAGRDGLIEMLQSYRRNSGVNPRITVVFDGKSHHDHGGGKNAGGIEVLFSRHEIADALILRLLKDRYRGAVLVTSDRALGEAAAPFASAIVRTGEFRDRLHQAAFMEEDSPEEKPSRTPRRDTKKKGNPRRAPRKERRRNRQLKNL
ncbi:MAG: NYN domain-containing protein [Nitrospinae bacterium]|nr:NYN domain-containing protein [Nitrospinota bacterium]